MKRAGGRAEGSWKDGLQLEERRLQIGPQLQITQQSLVLDIWLSTQDTAPPEDPGLIPGTHMGLTPISSYSRRESDALFWCPWGPDMLLVPEDTHRQNTVIFFFKIKKPKNKFTFGERVRDLVL